MPGPTAAAAAVQKTHVSVSPEPGPPDSGAARSGRAVAPSRLHPGCCGSAWVLRVSLFFRTLIYWGPCSFLSFIETTCLSETKEGRVAGTGLPGASEQGTRVPRA